MPTAQCKWTRAEPMVHATAIVVTVLVAIVAGLALRVCGFVGGAYSWFLMSSAGDDSWMPMRLAFQRAGAAIPQSMYDLFFVQHVKFQYPPSSLLLYSGLDMLGITPTDQVMNAIVWLSILATPPLIFWICLVYMVENRSVLRFSRAQEYTIAGSFAVATLFFYPIMIAWRLGQVQGLLNLLFAGACLCWLMGGRAAAGILIGATCLIKPQFCLFLIWGVLRREHGFVLGQVATFAAGLLASVMLYGWQAHVDYLDVLAYISRHGEIFWDNTSVNGLINRFMHPDETLIFKYGEFPPYDRLVYISTLVSSVVIDLLAFIAVGRSSGRGSVFDFMTAGFCFTLASPIAWGHHFGIAMPMFALLLIASGRPSSPHGPGVFTIAAIAFLAFSNYWNITDLLAGGPLTVLQSWRLLAAFGVLWLLYRMTAGDTRSGRAGHAMATERPTTFDDRYASSSQA